MHREPPLRYRGRATPVNIPERGVIQSGGLHDDERGENWDNIAGEAEPAIFKST